MPVTVQGQTVKAFSFPGGERHVVLQHPYAAKPVVTVDFRSSDDLMDLLLVTDALDKHSQKTLNILYFPYARQDRRANLGEAQSLRVVANLIDSLGYDEIIVWDPHSDVLENLFTKSDLAIVPQHELVHRLVYTKGTPKNLGIIAPDAGALKKIYKSAELIEHQALFVGRKIRDTKTGAISNTVIDGLARTDRYLIIDDICDGGRTFIELAKAVKKFYPDVPIDLYVTHGIFSKGLEPLTEHFDTIFCPNIMNDTIDRSQLVSL